MLVHQRVGVVNATDVGRDPGGHVWFVRRSGESQDAAGCCRMLQDAGEGISTLLQPLIFGSTLRQQGESGDGESWNSGAAMR